MDVWTSSRHGKTCAASSSFFTLPLRFVHHVVGILTGRTSGTKEAGYLTKGSLEVKLPTIWTYGRAEVGRVREEKGRRKNSNR